MIDLIIICAYFLIIVFIGIYKSSRKVQNINDFAVAQKSLPISVLIFTFLATSFGAGSTVGDAAKIHQDGIIFLFGMSGFFVFCLIMIFFLAKYFDERFAKMISPGDIIKYFYGSKAEFIVGVLGVFVSTFVVAGQIKGMAVFLSHYSGLSQHYVIIAAGLMVAIYTAIGGVRAVAITDIIQWITIVIALPAIVIIVCSKAGGVAEVFSNLPGYKLSIIYHPKFYEYLVLFIGGCLPFLWMYPPVIQRYLMAKNHKGIKAMYISELIARPIVMILVMILAFSCLNIMPDVLSNEIIPNLINQILSVGFRGAIVAMILASGMSTADSHLNASSILITKHVVQYIIKLNTTKSQIAVLRMMTIILALLSMLLAFSEIEIVHIVIYGFCLWGVGFSVPMVIGLLKIQTNPIIFWSSLIVGIISFIYSYYVLQLPGFAAPVFTVFASLVASLLAIFVSTKKLKEINSPPNA